MLMEESQSAASIDHHAARTPGRPLEFCEDVVDEEPANKRLRSNGSIAGAHGSAVDVPAAVVPMPTASLQTAIVSGALLACQREVSGRHRKEIFGLLHRAAAALGSSFALTATRIDDAPSVLFVTCSENQTQAGSDCAAGAMDSSGSRDATQDTPGTVGVQALIEQVLQSIGRGELLRPANSALIRLQPVQMRVQPGSLDVRVALQTLHQPTRDHLTAGVCCVWVG